MQNRQVHGDRQTVSRISLLQGKRNLKTTQRTHISTHIYTLYQFHRTKQVTRTLEEGRQFPPQVPCVLRRRARHLDEQWKNVLSFFFFLINATFFSYDHVLLNQKSLFYLKIGFYLSNNKGRWYISMEDNQFIKHIKNE